MLTPDVNGEEMEAPPASKKRRCSLGNWIFSLAGVDPAASPLPPREIPV